MFRRSALLLLHRQWLRGSAQSILPQQAPKNLIAAQIRDQGYSCEKPISAQEIWRAQNRMKPFGYSDVRTIATGLLVPDMAAHVTRLK